MSILYSCVLWSSIKIYIFLHGLPINVMLYICICTHPVNKKFTTWHQEWYHLIYCVKTRRHFQVPPVPVLWVWRCRAIVCLVTLWILHLEWSPTEKVCQSLRKVKYIIKETNRTVYLNFVLQSLDQLVPVFARVAEYSR